MQCATCGFITAEATPTHEELKKLCGLGNFNGEEYLDYKAEAEPTAELSAPHRGAEEADAELRRGNAFRG